MAQSEPEPRVRRATDLQVLQVVFLDVLGQVVDLKQGKTSVCYHVQHHTGQNLRAGQPTWTELVMVLRANSVAQSLMVDWLSNAPCVSISRTATCNVTRNRRQARGSAPQRRPRDRDGPTLDPSGFSTTNSSFHARMPVVSLSQPPRHLKPVRGSSSLPIQDPTGDWTHPTETNRQSSVHRIISH